MSFLLCITLPQINIGTLVMYTIQIVWISRISLWFYGFNHCGMWKAFGQQRQTQKQRSALLLTTIPHWFCSSQRWESKLSFQLSAPIMARDMQHWLQKFIYLLFKTWMGKCTQTPFFPHPFLPIRRAVYFFIWPYERLGKLFHQYSDKGCPRFLRDIAKGRRKKNKTPPKHPHQQ